MDKLKCSPWPWTVKCDGMWPFKIVTTDANGGPVATDSLYGHSSKDRTFKEAVSACHFKPEDRDSVRQANETAVANAVLRGAAPELLEVAMRLVAGYDASDYDIQSEARQAREIISKATGGAQ